MPALVFELVHQPLEQRVDVAHSGESRELVVADQQHFADQSRADARAWFKTTIAFVTRSDALVWATHTARRD